jgi:aldehyde:ferredoxin oxidoreductase
MTDGYAGKILRIDLTSQKIQEEELSDQVLRRFIGGVGIGAYYLYREVPPDTNWSDPNNRMIIATGPLTGTSVGGSGGVVVVTKGPLTNGAASCEANGFLGAYLKFNGFDGIIISGAASKLSYLYIGDGKAEIRDAAYLSGKDTWDTERLIKEELNKGEREVSVFSIGIAGEKLVKFACIVGDKGHSASHNGIGAVMGAKKLKAIAVERMKTRPALYDKERLSLLAKDLYKKTTQADTGLHHKWGTLGDITKGQKRLDLGYLPIKNLTTNIFPEGKYLTEEHLRSQAQFKYHWRPCWACRFHHCHLIEILEGPFAGYSGEAPEYELAAGFGSLIGNTDLAGMVVLANEVDRLGMDGNESAWVLAWVMECYEKGLISQKDMDGLNMSWGNVSAARNLLHKIANREGFCDIIAEGVKSAAEQIGGQAQELAVYTKRGNTPRMHDHRASWPFLLDTVTSDRGRDMDAPLVMGIFTPQETVQAFANVRGKGSISDSLVVCKFNIIGISRDDLAELVNSATGWSMNGDDVKRLGLRISNLLRVFNVKNGMTRDLDAPSLRYSSMVLDGPNKGQSIAPVWDDILDSYYQSMGWDVKTGKPLSSTLKELGLDDIVVDI